MEFLSVQRFSTNSTNNNWMEWKSYFFLTLDWLTEHSSRAFCRSIDTHHHRLIADAGQDRRNASANVSSHTDPWLDLALSSQVRKVVVLVVVSTLVYPTLYSCNTGCNTYHKALLIYLLYIKVTLTSGWHHWTSAAPTTRRHFQHEEQHLVHNIGSSMGWEIFVRKVWEPERATTARRSLPVLPA